MTQPSPGTRCTTPGCESFAVVRHKRGARCGTCGVEEDRRDVPVTVRALRGLLGRIAAGSPDDQDVRAALALVDAAGAVMGEGPTRKRLVPLVELARTLAGN